MSHLLVHHSQAAELLDIALEGVLFLVKGSQAPHLAICLSQRLMKKKSNLISGHHINRIPSLNHGVYRPQKLYPIYQELVESPATLSDPEA